MAEDSRDIRVPARGGPRPPSRASLLVPGAYWLRRYARAGMVAFLLRLALIDGVALALVLAFPANGGRGRLVATYLLARAAYTFAYEVGYFANDFWAARREGSAVASPPGGALTLAVAVRGLAVLGALALIPLVAGGAGSVQAWTAGAMAVGLVTFTVHNSIFFPWRIPTFAALYLVRYSLAVPLLRPDAVPAASAVWLALAGGFAAKYWADRCPGHPEWGVWNRTRITLVLRAAALLLLAFAVVAPFLERLPWHVPAAFALAFLLVDGAYVLLHGAGAVRNAYRRERWEVRHMHSRLSHDATLDVEELAAFLRASGRSTLYLSDHAEDVAPEDLEALRGELAEREEDIRPGVEVTVLDQHVLLEEIRRWDGPQRAAWDVEELRRRRGDYARAIWAHPHFSIRRMALDASYRRGFVELGRAVDGVEIVNRKPDRTWNHAWRSLLVGLLAVADRRCHLTVGLDGHHRRDLDSALGEAG